MSKEDRNLFLIGIAGVTFLILFLWLIFSRVIPAFASQQDKIYWCHTEPNGNSQTLHLPLQALQNAGHVNASGNLLHAGDHAGACVDPTPSVVTPTPSVIPDCKIQYQCPLSPTPDITVTPTATPTASPTPTVQTQTNSGTGGGGDEGRHSCPQCEYPYSKYDGEIVAWK